MYFSLGATFFGFNRSFIGILEDKKHVYSDQKVSVHLMITIQKVSMNVESAPASLQTLIDTRLTLTPSVIPNSNYVIMISG
jgi:hypothetical protein